MKDSPAARRKRKGKGRSPSIADGPTARKPPFPPRAQIPPTFHLTSMKQMDGGDQQRFDLLLNLLIERRTVRLLEKMK